MTFAVEHMHRAPLAAIAEFEAYASEQGAAYDIDECFEAFAIREADRARIPIPAPR